MRAGIGMGGIGMGGIGLGGIGMGGIGIGKLSQVVIYIYKYKRDGQFHISVHSLEHSDTEMLEKK